MPDEKRSYRSSQSNHVALVAFSCGSLSSLTQRNHDKSGSKKSQGGHMLGMAKLASFFVCPLGAQLSPALVEAKS